MDSSARSDLPPGAANIPAADARRARLRIDSGRDEQFELDFDQLAHALREDWDLVRDVEPALPGPATSHRPKLSWDWSRLHNGAPAHTAETRRTTPSCIPDLRQTFSTSPQPPWAPSASGT